MRIYSLDEQLVCTCGHKWANHHHGVVMNKSYVDYPLNIHGLIAEECEYNQRYGYFLPRPGDKTMCTCSLFKPRALNVRKIVAEWNKAHDAMRRNK